MEDDRERSHSHGSKKVRIGNNDNSQDQSDTDGPSTPLLEREGVGASTTAPTTIPLDAGELLEYSRSWQKTLEGIIPAVVSIKFCTVRSFETHR